MTASSEPIYFMGLHDNWSLDGAQLCISTNGLLNIGENGVRAISEEVQGTPTIQQTFRRDRPLRKWPETGAA